MAVKIILDSGSAIMTDGDWNGSPDNYFQNLTVDGVEDTNMDVEDQIVLDTDLSGFDLEGATGGETLEVDLVVLGDHNNPDGESLRIETTYGSFTDDSLLLVDGATSTLWEGEIEETTTGAQPNQGNLFIIDSDGSEIQATLPPGQSGGADNFTADTVTDIINEDASLISKDGESNEISGSFAVDESATSLTLDLTIPEEDSPEDGVDISQTSATASLVVDFDSDKDISNMVFYFGNGEGDCLKLKIDEFDDFWANLNPGYDSTSTLDMMIDDATLKALFNDFFGDDLDAGFDEDGDGQWEDDWEFGGFSTKAGANFDLDYTDNQLKKEANGEGEYIGLTALADDCYGVKHRADFSIDAAEYDAGTMTWESNIDDLFA